MTLYAEGEGAEAALDELAAMLGSDLDDGVKSAGVNSAAGVRAPRTCAPGLTDATKSGAQM